MSEMNEILARYGIDYTFYNAVFAILLLLIGGVFGALIGGRKRSAECGVRSTHKGHRCELIVDDDEDDWIPELPTKGGARHGEKVTICGAEWTIM